MGIKNFIKVLKYYCPNTINFKKINDYSGKIIGIDANLMIYKNIFAIRKKTDLFNGKIKVTHINSMVNKLNGFKKYCITPIFVFDGGYPSFKEDAMIARDKTGISVSYQEFEDCRELIKLYGYRIIDAKLEADVVLAKLSRNKEIDYIVSNDMDILIFGGLNLLKDFTVDKSKFIIELNLEEILKSLEMNREQLIDVALILGTDYNVYLPKSVGVGPVNAVRLIREWGSIKAVWKKVGKDYNEVFNYFLSGYANCEYTVLDYRVFNKIGLIDFFKKHGYEKKYYSKYI
jgi:flap endonuclease-1